MRAILAVPLLRDDEAVGVIVLFNSVVKSFTDKQIALVTTFADQAVIAIENTRLFEAEQASKRELQAVAGVSDRDQRGARASSAARPPTLQPVFDTIAQSAARLCDGHL